MKIQIVKLTMTLGFVLSLSSNAFAEIDFCKTTLEQNIVRLETVVKVQGLIKINPMYSYDSQNLNEADENAMFVLGIDDPIHLEQHGQISYDFSGPVNDNFSCTVDSVTLILSKKQRLMLNSSIENKNLFFEATGTIRWSESSLELAGNAVLSEVIDLSTIK